MSTTRAWRDSVLFLLVLCFFATCAIAQNPSKSHQRAKTDPEVEKIHSRIRNDRDPHDAFLQAAFIYDKTTVPVILERFAREYGKTEPEVNGDSRRGFVCTQIHLIDAIRSITNTDQGMWYPRWASWWEANQNLSLRQWKLNGFASAGFHITDPMDHTTALELIEIMGKNSPLYLSRNAQFLLLDAPQEMLSKWLELAATSDQQLLRLGVVRYAANTSSGNEALLHKLMTDSDPEISEQANAALKDLRRSKK
jgi:hypothetical protein